MRVSKLLSNYCVKTVKFVLFYRSYTAELLLKTSYKANKAITSKLLNDSSGMTARNYTANVNDPFL